MTHSPHASSCPAPAQSIRDACVYAQGQHRRPQHSHHDIALQLQPALEGRRRQAAPPVGCPLHACALPQPCLRADARGVGRFLHSGVAGVCAGVCVKRFVCAFVCRAFTAACLLSASVLLCSNGDNSDSGREGRGPPGPADGSSGPGLLHNPTSGPLLLGANWSPNTTGGGAPPASLGAATQHGSCSSLYPDRADSLCYSLPEVRRSWEARVLVCATRGEHVCMCARAGSVCACVRACVCRSAGEQLGSTCACVCACACVLSMVDTCVWWAGVCCVAGVRVCLCVRALVFFLWWTHVSGGLACVVWQACVRGCVCVCVCV